MFVFLVLGCVWGFFCVFFFVVAAVGVFFCVFLYLNCLGFFGGWGLLLFGVFVGGGCCFCFHKNIFHVHITVNIKMN